MLQISQLKDTPELAIEKLRKKHVQAEALVSEILAADETRRKIQNSLDQVLAESNSLASRIGDLMKQGKREEAAAMKEKTGSLKEQSKRLQEEMEAAERVVYDRLVQLPNLPHDLVPEGRTAEDNQEVYTWGDIPALSDQALPHWELASKYKLIDFEAGVKLSGAGFPVYQNKGAKLQRALINYFLDQASLNGYTETQPPILVNEDSAFATGQLPDKEGQMYLATADSLYLIPTAEVPITNLYRDTILNELELPVKHAGYTPCFRREAGSYGKDVRGLNRLHQFDKVEIVQIAHPEKSYEVLEEMRGYVAHLVQSLGLPFRIIRLCGGDMSFASAMTYDFEVYSAAQKRWLEVSSVSNFETFQSNRLKLRFKGTDKKTRLAHTLNGSAMALPRIVAALLENNQTSEGIRVPEVLVPYTGFALIS